MSGIDILNTMIKDKFNENPYRLSKTEYLGYAKSFYYLQQRDKNYADAQKRKRK